MSVVKPGTSSSSRVMKGAKGHDVKPVEPTTEEAIADVVGSGAILLGPHVVCDGFHRDRPARVQTHVHVDHMTDFETSKGMQHVYMSIPTRQLLEAEYNADLCVRSNIVDLHFRTAVSVSTSRVTLLPSGHMLGAAQVAVELDDGRRLGYSGDFAWPLEDVIQVDTLVVDSTYGSPHSVRRYSQEDAEHALFDLLRSAIGRGAVYLVAHRGTLQRAARMLSEMRDIALVASQRVTKELSVYETSGYCVPRALASGTPEAREAVRSGRALRVFDGRDQLPIDMSDGTSITLSAYWAQPDDPVVERSDKSFSVALSDHADFNGTLAYIAETGARHVITDNTRGRGVELAIEVGARLGVTARPSSNVHRREWGLR